MTVLRVGVVADDLIWADRLTRAVGEAGAEAIPVATAARLPGVLAGPEPPDAVVVDLTLRAGDAAAAIEAAALAGRRVLAVGPHDDDAARAGARAAGAERVLAYRAVHEHGPAAFADWLASVQPAEAGAPADPSMVAGDAESEAPTDPSMADEAEGAQPR